MKKLAVPEAIAVLIGTIIGAGVFTLPYVAIHSGLMATLIWLIIISFIIIYLHLAFGEIVLRTKKEFRLPGYVVHYLNSSAKKLILLITFFTFSFSLLIYLLLGSQFLKVILNSVWTSFSFPQGLLVVLFWLVLSAVVLSKNKRLSRINFYLSFALLFVFFIIIIFALPHFKTGNINWCVLQAGDKENKIIGNTSTKRRLTKRVPDVWDSVAFSDIFLALGFPALKQNPRPPTRR